MQKSTVTFIKPLLLAMGMCVLLSGCDMLGFSNPFDENRTNKQTVAGPLRIPVENQQDMARPVSPPPAMTAPMQETMPPPAPAGAAMPLPPQGAAVPPPGANPYDYYDQEGHPVAPKATAHTPPPQSSLFNFFGSRHVAMQQPEPPLTTSPALASEDVAMSPPVAGNAPSSEPKHSSSFFAWLFGSGEGPLSPADKAAEKAPYPALSSVPPTPPALQAARTANMQGMQQLQSDWQAAQQNKTTLDGEPSNLAPQAPATN